MVRSSSPKSQLNTICRGVGLSLEVLIGMPLATPAEAFRALELSSSHLIHIYAGIGRIGQICGTALAGQIAEAIQPSIVLGELHMPVALVIGADHILV